MLCRKLPSEYCQITRGHSGKLVWIAVPELFFEINNPRFASGIPCASGMPYKHPVNNPIGCSGGDTWCPQWIGPGRPQVWHVALGSQMTQHDILHGVYRGYIMQQRVGLLLIVNMPVDVDGYLCTCAQKPVHIYDGIRAFASANAMKFDSVQCRCVCFKSINAHERNKTSNIITSSHIMKHPVPSI